MPDMADLLKEAGLMSDQQVEQCKQERQAEIDAEQRRKEEKCRKRQESELVDFEPTKEKILRFKDAFIIMFQKGDDKFPIKTRFTMALVEATLYAENRVMDRYAIIKQMAIYRSKVTEMMKTTEGTKDLLFESHKTDVEPALLSVMIPKSENKPKDAKDKLTDVQVENWRKVLANMIGPYALTMPRERIEEFKDAMQKRVYQMPAIYGQAIGDLIGDKT